MCDLLQRTIKLRACNLCSPPKMLIVIIVVSCCMQTGLVFTCSYSFCSALNIFWLYRVDLVIVVGVVPYRSIDKTTQSDISVETKKTDRILSGKSPKNLLARFLNISFLSFERKNYKSHESTIFDWLISLEMIKSIVYFAFVLCCFVAGGIHEVSQAITGSWIRRY